MDVFWERLGQPGQEVCTLDMERGLTLSGTALTAFEGQPASVTYQVQADPASGVTRTARVTLRLAGAEHTLAVRRSDEGRWWVNDRPDPALDGLDDVDLGVTPATNTLPIRRLALAVGQSAATTAAWVRFPALTVTPLAQRYTRQAEHRYLYESLASGYRALLAVDANGVVQHYEGQWQRLRLEPPDPGDPAISALRPEDFDDIVSAVDGWWGRPVAHLLHRFMFAHFAATSFVVRAQGRPVAFLLGFISPTHPDAAYVHMLGVDPAHRGQQWGRRLYDAFFSAVRPRGVIRVGAVTSPINRASIAFHQAMGFTLPPGDRLVDGIPVHAGYDGPGVDRVVLLRHLD